MSCSFRSRKMSHLLPPRTGSTASGRNRLNSSRPTFNVLTYGETARAQPAAVSRSRASRATAIGARGVMLLLPAPGPPPASPPPPGAGRPAGHVVADRIGTLRQHRGGWPMGQSDDVGHAFDAALGESRSELAEDAGRCRRIVEYHGADGDSGGAGEDQLECVETSADATHSDD